MHLKRALLSITIIQPYTVLSCYQPTLPVDRIRIKLTNLGPIIYSESSKAITHRSKLIIFRL